MSFRAALVFMPWASASAPSLAVSLLAAALRRQGIAADVHYLNIPFAKRLGPTVNDALSCAGVQSEWAFSYSLFGPAGSGELDNRFENLTADGHFSPEWMNSALEPSVASQVDLKSIAERHVPAFLQECLDGLPWHRYSLVGFSVSFSQTLASLALAQRLKQRFPSIHIAFGGVNVHGRPGLELLKGAPWVDSVVHDEGEEALPLLARRVRSGLPDGPLPGISFRKGGVLHEGGPQRKTPMAAVPLPDFSDYFRQLAATGTDSFFSGELPMEMSRGCGWGERRPCKFCGITDMPFRAKPAKQIVRELSALSRKHRVFGFRFVDNLLDRSLERSVFPKLRQRDFRMHICVRASLNKRELGVLARGGVRSVLCGIETLHTRILKLMDKGTLAIQNVRFLKWAQQAGIQTFWNFIHGFPGERDADYEEMERRLPFLTHLTPPSGVHRLGLFRFAPYFERPSEHGFRGVRSIRIYRWVYPEKRFDIPGLAYYFSYDPEGTGGLRDAVDRIKLFCDAWIAAQPELFLFHRRGAGFLKVYDRRLLGADRRPVFRVHALDGLAARVLTLCDSFMSRGEVVKRLARGGRAEEGLARDIGAVLDELVDRGLLYREEDRYLTLSLPAAGYPGAVQRRAEELERGSAKDGADGEGREKRRDAAKKAPSNAEAR